MKDKALVLVVGLVALVFGLSHLLHLHSHADAFDRQEPDRITARDEQADQAGEDAFDKAYRQEVKKESKETNNQLIIDAGLADYINQIIDNHMWSAHGTAPSEN